MPDIWKIFHAKLAGHIRYYGVSFNAKQLERFVYQATRILFKWLNRRSQRKSFTWDQFSCFLQAFPLPQVENLPPSLRTYSCVNAFIMSLVPELGALGSNEGGARATGSSTLSYNGQRRHSSLGRRTRDSVYFAAENLPVAA